MTDLDPAAEQVADVLRVSAWRWFSVDQLDRRLPDLRRRAVRRALDRLAAADVAERHDNDGHPAVRGAWRWTGPDGASPPDVCPRCDDPLDLEHTTRDGSLGCRRCGALT